MAMPISAEAKEDLQEMDLLPHMHIMADRSREKVRTHAANPRNSGAICPILLIGQKRGQKICQPPINTVPSLPIPPVVENTRGVNEASSTSRTLSPY